MAQDPNRLVWVDMEMTGLEPDRDRILEVAVIVTDAHLEVVAEGPVIAVHQSDEALAGMDEWNQNTHGKSGLIERVRASKVDEAAAVKILREFLDPLLPAKASPMCGNSIGQDRRFMARWMPELEDWFHYRNIDVSTLKELAKRWNPAVFAGVKKAGAHTALADIRESIAELAYYRDAFLRLP
ncbi:oligoribonuclease [Niveibacterium terrae]|uniref:oligoribonuclease n=1 Tax=Niveibacterium terrae TaxID=3373598 RepID=UPI003A91BE63